MSSHGQPPFSGVLISPIATKAAWRICVDHIRLWTVVAGKLLSEAIVVIIPTTIQPVIIENIVRLSGRGVSHRELSRTIGVSQGAI